MKLPNIGIGVERSAGVARADRVAERKGIAPSFWCQQLCFLKQQDCYFYCTLTGGHLSCFNNCDAQHAQCVANCSV